MTKKHFIALADAIREHNRVASNRIKNGDDSSQLFTSDHLSTLCDFMRSQNYSFMSDRWLGYIAGTNGKNGGAIKQTKEEEALQGSL